MRTEQHVGILEQVLVTVGVIPMTVEAYLPAFARRSFGVRIFLLAAISIVAAPALAVVFFSDVLVAATFISVVVAATGFLGYCEMYRALREINEQVGRVQDEQFDIAFQWDRIDEIGETYTALEETAASLGESIERAHRETENAKEARKQAEQARERAETEQERAEALSLHLEQKADDFRTTMQQAADGDLTERMDPESDSEAMTDIGEAVNAMLADIEELVGVEEPGFQHVLSCVFGIQDHESRTYLVLLDNPGSTVAELAADRVEARTVVRDFYQSPPGGVPDGAGESFQVPVPAEELGLPEEVEPGADTSYDREAYGRPEIERQIFKKGSKIPEEDINDNLFDLLADHIDGHAKNMSKRLDSAAFSVLDAAAPGAEAVGDADGTLSFQDINAAVTELADRGEDGFTADMALVDPAGKESITNFLAERGTDLGDEVVQNGEIGEFGGIQYMFTTNVSLGATSNPEAIVVDSDQFGYEGEWQPVDTDQETDFDADAIKVKIKSAYGWTDKRPGAAVRVEG